MVPHIRATLSVAALTLILIVTGCSPQAAAPAQPKSAPKPASEAKAPTGPAASGAAQPPAPAAAAPTAAPAAAKPAGPTPKRGGNLTFAMDRDLVNMNPLVATSSNDKWIRELMFDSLVGIDLKGAIQPNLAESWSISPDGKEYTFKLRKGVKFHSGQEMTSEDARFSIDYTLNPKNGAYGATRLALVEKVETPDSSTLKLTLKGPSPEFLFALTTIQSFSVVPKGSLTEGTEKITTFPPGTGPFKFAEWTPKQRLVVERFDDFWGQKAYLDKVTLVAIEDATVRFTALRSGDVDLEVRTPLEWVRQLANGELKGVSSVEAPQGALHRIQFNTVGSAFENKTLRQAVAYAVDPAEVLHAAFFGFGTPSDQKYPRGAAWYMEGVPAPSFNLDRARTLLREAGYNGETYKMIVELQVTSLTASTAIQAQAKRIGMNLDIEVLEVGAYNDRTRKGDFTFRFSGANFYPDPSTTYGPDLTCEADPKNRVSNETGYCDKEMDGLLEKAKTEVIETERRAIFKQIVTKVNDDLPALYIGFSPRFFAARDYVKDFSTSGDGTFRWWAGGLNYTWLDK